MESYVSSLLRRSLLLLVLGSPWLAARAQEKRDTRPMLDPPPPAMPAAVSVARAQKIDIPLRIYGVQNEPLRYLIKRPPMHGRLSEPRPTAREVSTVTYEPPADLAITADRFTFSVQSHAGVSAPVEVTISIVDVPAQFAVPATLEFGEILAGERTVREIEVANRGGGFIEGEVQVDPPLQIEGRTKYRLAGGDYAYFKIVFAPSEGGVFRREIRYTSHREFITSVNGRAQAPVSVEPTRLVLRHGPDSTVRTGAFEVINRTDDDRAFKVVGGARLQVPTEVKVPAHARGAVPVSTRAEDVAAIADTAVRLESGNFFLEIPVTAETVGPMLRLPQASVGLGRVDAMRGLQASVEIENIGGSTADVSAEVGAPFALPEPAFTLQPGERKRVRLNVLPASPQRYRTWLKFKTSRSTAELEVDAELVTGGASTASRPHMEPAPAATPTPPEEPPMPDLRIAGMFRVWNVKPTSATLEWPIEVEDAENFRIERLVLTRDSSGRVRNSWVEISGTTFARRELRWEAALIGLKPNQNQTVRILPLGPDGKPRPPVARLDFVTPPERSLPRPGLISSLLIALLAVGAFALFRRLRQHYTEPISGF